MSFPQNETHHPEELGGSGAAPGGSEAAPGQHPAATLLDPPLPEAEIERATREAPPHLRPLFMAMKLYGIAVIFVSRSTPLWIIRSEKVNGAVIIVGDDDGQATGPSGFRLPPVQQALAAAKSVWIHAAAPDSEQYSVLAGLVAAGAVIVLIETTVDHQGAWQNFLAREAPHLGTLTISAKPPILLSAETGHA